LIRIPLYGISETIVVILMKNIKVKLIKSISYIKETINNYEYRVGILKKTNSFLRRRKLDFQETMLFLLNLNKKSMQIELDHFFEKVKGEHNMTISKQAFSKSRQNISPDAFAPLHEITVTNMYEDGDYKKFKGFRLLAIDGSMIALYNTEEMREYFGYIKNRHSNTAMAQASILYDVENEIIINSSLDRYEKSEREMAIEHIKELSRFCCKEDLVLFDRGYPSVALISELTDRKVKYVMRVSPKFVKEINEFNEDDGVVEVFDKEKNRTIKIRVITVQIETKNKNGEII
jgi:hypothetical protein